MVIHLPIAPGDLERVRGVLDGTIEPVPTRAAVSVVLSRDAADGEGGLEVLLLRRSLTLAFAPGRYVYPGGSIDPTDADPAPWAGRPPADPAVVVAGVRETFEESGVLLAVDADGQPAAVTRADPGWDDDRVALERGEVSLGEVLRRRELRIDAETLRPFAHWVTPATERRRFDTFFLLAALPAGQEVWDIVGESDLAEWVRPADALRGERSLMPPTRAVLRTLRTEPSLAEALARPRVVERIQPGVRLDGDRLELLLP